MRFQTDNYFRGDIVVAKHMEVWSSHLVSCDSLRFLFLIVVDEESKG